jgi:hypothetical protein
MVGVIGVRACPAAVRTAHEPRQRREPRPARAPRTRAWRSERKLSATCSPDNPTAGRLAPRASANSAAASSAVAVAPTANPSTGSGPPSQASRSTTSRPSSARASTPTAAQHTPVKPLESRLSEVIGSPEEGLAAHQDS